jgi:hypothetical protein
MVIRIGRGESDEEDVATPDSPGYARLRVGSADANLTPTHPLKQQSHVTRRPALEATYSTVTDFARFRGWSTLEPRLTAM